MLVSNTCEATREPPYSAGQSSANDNNANLAYPTLDGRIADTYAKHSTGKNKNSLYDSYIRAFRWASDRIQDHGVVAFVSNGGWVDGNTADGIRKTFAKEFSDVYVYNLRGNMRSADWRKEGGQIFGAGSQTTVAILVGVKNPDKADFDLHYAQTVDGATREEKLAALSHTNLASIDWQPITPNEAGDWLNQRNQNFDTFPAIADETTAHFVSHGRGVETTRDAWCYNYSRAAVETNMRSMIDFYNQQALTNDGTEASLDLDATKISWSRNIRRRALNGVTEELIPDHLRSTAIYRPFCKQAVYFDPVFNSVPGKNATYFPTPHHQNVGFYVIGEGAAKDFSLIAIEALPDVQLTGAQSNGQFFPRWTYEKAAEEGALFGTASGELDEWGYRRVDNITDAILAVYQEKFGPSVSKDDIFFYVYGVLHSTQYREAFAADLKRMLPRIPLAADLADFQAFADAGRRLSDLHTGYEQIEPYPLHEQAPMGVDEWELYRVTKMTWQNKETKKELIYNSHITLGDIPAEAHEYMLGSRSALEWLIDRYQVKTDKASGIVNDPNAWAREHNDPRYIIDLVKRVTRVSVETMRIVKTLPELPLN